jgi:transposase
VAGLAPVKRNRFIALDGAVKSVNRELEAKARDLAGLKGYVTNLAACPDGTPVTPEFVIGSYLELWNIEKSFRMSKHDLRARPVYHRKRDSIEAHLTIVSPRVDRSGPVSCSALTAGLTPPGDGDG